MPHSYIKEAQGKCYHRTREHLRPIYINLPSPKTHQPQTPNPKLHHSHIPKLSSHSKHTSQPKISTLAPALHPPVVFKDPSNPLSLTLVLMLAPQSRTCFDTYPILTPFPMSEQHPSCFSCPRDLNQHQLHLLHWRRLQLRASCQSVTYPQSPTVSQVLQATHVLQYPVHRTPCGHGYP